MKQSMFILTKCNHSTISMDAMGYRPKVTHTSIISELWNADYDRLSK